MKAVEARDHSAKSLCESAWQQSRDVAVAVAGATIAAMQEDAEALQQWAERVPPTIEGARVLHFWGQFQAQRGDLKGAEATLRRTLELRIDRDPLRATNTALLLIELVRSSQPAEQTVALSRIAWEQAQLDGDPEVIAIAATTLAEIFLELGELRTAQAIADGMDTSKASQPWRDLVLGRLHAARGENEVAAALFERASAAAPLDTQWFLYLDARVEQIQALLELRRTKAARDALDRAAAVAKRHGTGSVDVECRLAAMEALVLLAEGDAKRAFAAVERGVATSSRDGARVLLLNVRGDLLMQQGDTSGAERAWREAADLLETWRASIPTVQLRAGLIAQHRRALESWLDSTAARGDVDGALEVTRRLVGRSLLDRIGQREANAATVEASIRDVEKRLVLRRELGVSPGNMRDLRQAPHDMVALMCGSHYVWALRRIEGRWSIDRVGRRDELATAVDAYMKNLSDRRAAERLGAALFPAESLPKGGAPIVAVLDRDLADIPLAGLRTANRYLVEHAPILELVVPDLIFAPLVERPWAPSISIGDPNGDLPGAAREARMVGSALAARAYVGPAATPELVGSAVGARVMHVATHSNLDDGRAALVLHGGLLSSIEIVNRKLAPRLAVIATCRSQVNDDPSTSLVAAFLASGALGVVGVKRALDDEAGPRIIEAFYRADGAVDPLRGLAQAQRAAIAARHPPQTWATLSFFGVGGWVRTSKG